MLDKEQIIQRIRAIIETGEGDILKDGRLLPERALVEYYQVGRRVIREALKELEEEGFVYRRQGMGTFISTRTPNVARISTLTSNTSPQEINEVRQEIEPALAKLAAMRATPSDIDQLRQFIERGRRAQTGSQYERWDSAFHAKVAQSARNELFRRVFELVNGVRTEQKWLVAREQSYSREHVAILLEQHAQIVAAIEERNPQKAEASMRAHIYTASHRFLHSETGSVEEITAMNGGI
jgi:DNA-binding FadR family transcriptional regulator